jgi:hypothetical protein
MGWGKLFVVLAAACAVVVAPACATNSRTQAVKLTDADAEGVFAAQCARAATLQRASSDRKGDAYRRMTNLVAYWSGRQDALTPDRRRREAQGREAAAALNERTGGRVDALALGTVLSDCRQRRGELEHGASS